MLTIIINNQALNFAPNSLKFKVALKIIKALNVAYMHSFSIACTNYVPVQSTEQSRFICACQLVHDNLADNYFAEIIRNTCIEKLKA